MKEKGREGERRRSRVARGLDGSQEERAATAARGGGRRWRGKKGLEVWFKIPTPFCANARRGWLCADLENKKKGEKVREKGRKRKRKKRRGEAREGS